MLKEQKGITLVALVITIIVLLILAGVTIAMLTGENGILNKATTAKEDTVKAEAVERINMELNALSADVLASTTKDKFDVTATTGDVDKTKANLPTGYTVVASNTDKTITITDPATTKSGSIVITAAGKATITAAVK